MMDKIQSLAKEAALHPQEQLLKVKEGDHKLYIGLPREMEGIENRICLTPEAVSILVNNGHDVWVETGAGSSVKFTDREYSDAGGKIVYSTEEVFAADIVLKVDPPTPQQVEYMKPGKTLISALQLGKLKPDFLEMVNKRKITGLAYEFIEDKVGGKPVVKSMSEIAGSTVILIAAEYLNSQNGKGVILGGITGVPPTKVVILGAGTVAEYAARTALGLGAEVKVFDNHLYKLHRLKTTLNNQIYTSTIDSLTLQTEMKRADVVIGALRSDDGGSPCVVTEEMIAGMNANSVVIDVCIDQGGCFETSQLTSHKSPIFRKFDVIHYCVPNIPSRVARTASIALSNIFTPMLLQISRRGGVEGMIYSKEWFMRGVYSYKGNLTNSHLARKFNMRFNDLELLIATRF